MDYRDTIAEAIAQALRQEPFALEKDPAEIRALLVVPKESQLGDHAFPCFTLARVLRQAPPKIAAQLAGAVREQLREQCGIARLEATGPYLNFFVDKASLAAQVLPAILEGDFLARRPANGIRIMIEYSQPNTHKAFHVGHTRNVALGDALVRVCEWAGNEVVAANYIGDVGAHIAKCLWYLQEYFRGEVPAEHRGEFLGQLYTRATELLDFTTLTGAPHPGVVTARVAKIAPHPTRGEWQVVTVDPGDGAHSVVCGGTGYRKGDIAAYARIGSQIGGRQVAVADRDGVESDGMICSEKEISLGDDRQRIHVFPAGTPIGVEIAELLRIPAVLDPGRSVIDEMKARQAGVDRILKDLEAVEPKITELWRETRQWSLDEFDRIYEWLGARFDHIFYESEVGDSGKEVVKQGYEQGKLVLSEGAIGADLSAWKLPFFLLLRSNGTGLYSTKDLALAGLKFEKFEIDRSVYVVGAEQGLHFQQVFKTLELLGYEKAKDCFHLSYGIVVLPDGKMSSRKGNIILFSQLRERLTQHIHREFLAKYAGEWPEEEITEAARRIAIATIKYGMLNHDNNKNIIFDMAEWTDPRGNTGPYLMYAYSRTRSILREIGEYDAGAADWSLLTHETEQQLLRRLVGFPETVIKAAEGYEPQGICIDLYDLARDFSRMYNACSVKRAETPALQAARAALVESTGKVIGEGLALLGIPTLERM